MTFQKSVFIFTGFIFFTFSLILSGCGSAETPTNRANANSANANQTAAKNTNNPMATTKKTQEETVNKAETITPVVVAYCDAMRKKDDATLRKIYSRASLQKLDADMKSENQKSIAEYLSSEPVGNVCEVRNEQIQGDKAVAEIRTETYPNGIKYVFVKEDGVWKLTSESPEFQSVKESSTNSSR